MTATVVTAYYQLNRNKYNIQTPCSVVTYDSHNPYMTWIKNLFKLKANIIFFTDAKTYETTLKSLVDESDKKNISIQLLGRNEFYANKHIGIDWDAQYRLDREREIHTTGVYDIWTQKVDFVRRAIQLPVYKSNVYAWVDAGCFRGYNEHDKLYESFPSTRYLEPGKIMVNIISQLREEEKALRHIHTTGGFVPNLKRDVVAATCLVGDKNAWKQFHDIYYYTVKRYYEKGFFVGREETVYTKCLIVHPEMFQTYTYHKELQVASSLKELFSDFRRTNRWFYFILYLSDPATSSSSSSVALLDPGKDDMSSPVMA